MSISSEASEDEEDSGSQAPCLLSSEEREPADKFELLEDNSASGLSPMIGSLEPGCYPGFSFRRHFVAAFLTIAFGRIRVLSTSEFSLTNCIREC